MALILMLLGTKGIDDRRGINASEDASLVCNNPHCISKSERGIKRLYKDGSCIYCDQKADKL